MYLVGAVADKARAEIVINYLRDVDRAAATGPPHSGLPHLMTIEVTPEEIGPTAIRLDEASRRKLVAAGVDPDRVEQELRGMQRGDRKFLADVVYGAKADVPRGEVSEQLRWFGVAPTEEEEERIARGETVIVLIGA